MIWQRVCIAAVLAVLAGPGRPAAAEPLSLHEAERLALEHNLELRAQVLETRARDAAVRREFGLYDPRFEATLAEGESRDLANFQFFTGDSGVENRRFDVALTQKLPTGADLTLSFVNRRDRVFTPPKPFLNPEYDSELEFSLVQPLLRNFGRTPTEEGISLAVKDREISIQDLRERVFDILTRVRNAYFDVLRFRDNLSYRQTSVALAEKVLEENRARVEAGVLPPIEVLEAEVGLKLRERELLDARRQYRDALDDLGVLLNATGTIGDLEKPLERPQIATGEEQGMRAALEKRPDVLRRLKEIERLTIERRVARNQTLPALDLSGRYSQKGVGEDYSDDLDLLVTEDIRNWEVALTFSYPLGNREARHEYRRTELRLQSRHAGLAQLREEVFKEVRAAIRQVEVNREKIEVTGKARELAQEQLRTLLARLEAGLVTTRDVLEGEEDLAQARTDQIAALADYNNAVTEYLRVTGRLLEHEGVTFTGPVAADDNEPLLEMRRR